MSKAPAVPFVRAFRDYVAFCRDRNWVVQAPSKAQARHPQRPFTSPRSTQYLPKQEPAIESVRTQDDDGDERVRLDVGRGSNFHRKNVQEYLRPLNNPKLRRAWDPISVKYPNEDAKKKNTVRMMLESSPLKSTVLHHFNTSDAQEIIGLLTEITPKPPTRHLPSPIATKDHQYNRYSFGTHVYSEIPPIPKFENTDQFEQYVYQLTHSTYHFKSSSKFNGVIPKILRNLFHPLNKNAMPFRSTNSFNYLIHYFGAKFDIATCRELVVQMREEGKNPNTTTYNIMLRNLNKVQTVQHMVDPLKVCLKFLKQMKAAGLKADMVTWNMIFTLFRDGQCKASLIKKRAELNIPVDEKFLHTVLKDWVDTEKADSKTLLTFLIELDIPLERKPSRLIMELLLKDMHYDLAYSLMLRTFEHYDRIAPDVHDLNLFLVAFNRVKRVDLCWGMMNNFREFGVRMNYDTYALLMRCFAKAGHWKNKFAAWRVAYHQMIADLDGTIAGEYWIRRMRASFKFVHGKDFELSSPLSEPELKLKHDVEGFTLEKGKIPVWFKKSLPEKTRLGMRRLGYHQSRVSKDKKRDESIGDEMERKKAKTIKYTDKITAISIAKAMEQRADYADEDQFVGLKRELAERGLIDG